VPLATGSGINIYWTRRGSGSPVLLIMGLSFTHEMWFRLTPALLGAGYETVLFDNRGMGRSETPPGPYRIRDMAKDAIAVLDASGIESAHVVGASMGGMIAQELAIRYPERVKTLLLGCTSYSGLRTWPKWSYAPPVRFSWATRMERERALRRMLYADTTPEERIEEDLVVRSKCSWTYNGFWNQLAGVLMWSSFRRLPHINVPSMVIHGDQDRLIPPRNGRVLASRIPGAQFELIQDAGHILATDQPEECCRLMLEFLASHPDKADRTVSRVID
jgi:3-oxoadipate enol-lactonase